MDTAEAPGQARKGTVLRQLMILVIFLLLVASLLWLLSYMMKKPSTSSTSPPANAASLSVSIVLEAVSGDDRIFDKIQVQVDGTNLPPSQVQEPNAGKLYGPMLIGSIPRVASVHVDGLNAEGVRVRYLIAAHSSAVFVAGQDQVVVTDAGGREQPGGVMRGPGLFLIPGYNFANAPRIE